MKRTSKLAGSCVAGFVFVGMAVMLVIQQQTLNRVRQENRSLRQQVDGLVAHADQLVVEKARLSTLLAASQTNAGVRSHKSRPENCSGFAVRWAACVLRREI